MLAAPPPPKEGQEDESLELHSWMLGAVSNIQERLHGAPARAPEKLDADPAWGEDGQLPEVFRFLAPPEPPQTAAPPKRAGFGGGFGGGGGATTAVAGGGGGFGRGSGAQAPVACLQRASAPQGAAALVGPAAETRSEMGGKDM